MAGPDKAYYMKGMLSFFMLWLLSRRPMNGQQIAGEIAKRKGSKPSPGTLYPALSELEKRGLIKGVKRGRSVFYTMTGKGRKSIKKSMEYFHRAFEEIFKNDPERS